jgi:adenylate kinase family enzyme
MDRVVVLGRGGAGKTVFARRLAGMIGAPAVELDGLFWTDPDLLPLTPDVWAHVQDEHLAATARWVADGDLGPYDVLGARLRRADTVVLLDFSLARCAWRALRRGRERADFWRWVITYRTGPVLAAVGSHAPGAELHVLRSPRAAAAWLRHRTQSGDPTPPKE